MEIDLELIRRTFFAEAEEKLQLMEEAALALEAGELGADDPELIATIFRTVHTIKGNSASLGYQDLAGFCHVLEDLLDRLRQSEEAVPLPPSFAGLLLQAVDALRRRLAGAESGKAAEPEETEADAGLLTALTGQAQQAAASRPDQPDALPGRLPAARKVAAAAPDHGPPLAQAARPGRGSGARSLRVDLSRLDRLLDLTGEITVARGRLESELAAQPASSARQSLALQAELDPLFHQLQELVTELRMVPIGPLFRQQVRTVRDLSAARGRPVRLVLEGEDVEVDAAAIEQLRDPLTHLIRNAVDHGIEPPTARRAARKDPCGRITLRARHSAGSLLMEIEDDGAGLDRARVAERARETGWMPEPLADGDLFQLLFEPGFSTAGEVTDLSGRGVGLDVVRRAVTAVRGTVEIFGQPGVGTRVTLRLPLALALLDGLAVSAGGETFVLPLDRVVECLDMPVEEHGRRGAVGLIQVRGAALPYVRLREFFALEGGSAAPRENVVVVEGEGGCIGLAVDALLGRSHTVLKSLGQLFRPAVGISGCALLGSGRLGLVLDLPALLREAVRQQAAARPAGVPDIA